MKISEILWKAANEHLCAVGEPIGALRSHFSCNAVAYAQGLGSQYNSDAKRFLKSLGCPVNSSFAFDGDFDDESQGARYAWLMFASMYAEEQGL